jgi:hypothetical protein
MRDGLSFVEQLIEDGELSIAKEGSTVQENHRLVM